MPYASAIRLLTVPCYWKFHPLLILLATVPNKPSISAAKNIFTGGCKQGVYRNVFRGGGWKISYREKQIFKNRCKMGPSGSNTSQRPLGVAARLLTKSVRHHWGWSRLTMTHPADWRCFAYLVLWPASFFFLFLSPSARAWRSHRYSALPGFGVCRPRDYRSSQAVTRSQARVLWLRACGPPKQGQPEEVRARNYESRNAPNTNHLTAWLWLHCFNEPLQQKKIIWKYFISIH